MLKNKNRKNLLLKIAFFNVNKKSIINFKTFLAAEPNVQDLTALKQKSKSDEPENLSLKKEPLNLEDIQKSPKPNSPVSLNSTEIESNVTIDKYETLSPQSSLQSFSIGGQIQDYHDYKSPLPYPPIPSSSALTMTSPTCNFSSYHINNCLILQLCFFKFRFWSGYNNEFISSFDRWIQIALF